MRLFWLTRNTVFLASGKIVIPHNVNRKEFNYCGIGQGLRIKVNALIGTASNRDDVSTEKRKPAFVEEAGCDALMDLSTGGNVDGMRRFSLEKANIAIGSVPIYQAAIGAIENRGSIVAMTAEDMFETIEKQAADGVDFMTFIVLTIWMLSNGCREAEGLLMWSASCGNNDPDAERLCNGAPYFILGTLATDVAPGYNRITSAIGGALACAAGADFLCYVTSAERLGLPTEEDVKERVTAARIAAHAADLARANKEAWEKDRQMARARVALDIDRQISFFVDPEKTKAARPLVCGMRTGLRRPGCGQVLWNCFVTGRS
ncbi:phosphomethylpyrimidine synthase [Peptococcaceae bacterium CEB3]|nr:phosphomethylpyrimidine synthase [Peptococcaceae bacterium CEB3]